MAACVRRALRHTAMRSASPATAMTMKAAPNSWLMLGAAALAAASAGL
jgi:hypothetical protein